MFNSPALTLAKAHMRGLQDALGLAKSPNDRAAIGNMIEAIAAYHALVGRLNALHRTRFSVCDDGSVDVIWGDGPSPSLEVFQQLHDARALTRTEARS